ncbi:hypothetical protein LTR20_009303 [Exophiala xenobiotica]|nr:hypothetical protein LTR40_007351 [Exophiala xenobiotica]KAK5361723.1 hypothetical protein LTS13_009724 [Exophiala xenobiotica]KAK5393960.1 hypothetical protein LTR79_008904 [Exophiala xenobiotica]KAK5408229.1 hypothetical protein LTR90_009685 [Exophiala xenobiotica]KAK5456362.1 hypothetical protein LTR20_009303 [Exophiala xenobiotica]
MVWTSNSEKTEAQSGRPRIIVRYFPEACGRLFVALLAKVFPLWRFLQFQVSGKFDDKDKSSLVWGRRWGTRNFSRALSRITQTHLDVWLPMSTYRHVAVAISRNILKVRDSSLDSRSENAALQTGHTIRLEDHHYVLNADMLAGIDEHTLLGFYQFSIVSYDHDRVIEITLNTNILRGPPSLQGLTEKVSALDDAFDAIPRTISCGIALSQSQGKGSCGSTSRTLTSLSHGVGD